jgi:hypothetical protein
MQAEGVDFRVKEERVAFAKRVQREFAEELGEVVRSYDPEHLLYFNDVAFEVQEKAGSYLEFECLPCKSGGYPYYAITAHPMQERQDVSFVRIPNPCG